MFKINFIQLFEILIKWNNKITGNFYTKKFKNNSTTLNYYFYITYEKKKIIIKTTKNNIHTCKLFLSKNTSKILATCDNKQNKNK